MTASSEQKKKFNVLFVDDEIEILKALKLQMSLLDGFTGHFISNPLEVLPYLEEEEIHIIVADVVMPEQDGISLLQEIKTKYPEIIRILLTAYGDYNTSLRAIKEAEVFGFITKPWNQDYLFGHLQLAMDMIKQGLDQKILQEIPFAVVAVWDDETGITDIKFTNNNEVIANKFAQRVFFTSSALFGEKYRFQNNLFTLPLKETQIVVRGLLESIEEINYGIFLFVEDVTNEKRRELDNIITSIEQQLYDELSDDDLQDLVSEI